MRLTPSRSRERLRSSFASAIAAVRCDAIFVQHAARRSIGSPTSCHLSSASRLARSATLAFRLPPFRYSSGRSIIGSTLIRQSSTSRKADCKKVPERHNLLSCRQLEYGKRSTRQATFMGTFYTDEQILKAITGQQANDGQHGRVKDLTAKWVRRPALRFLAGRRSGSHSAPPDRPLPCRDCQPRPSRSPSCAPDRPHN